MYWVYNPYDMICVTFICPSAELNWVLTLSADFFLLKNKKKVNNHQLCTLQMIVTQKQKIKTKELLFKTSWTTNKGLHKAVNVLKIQIIFLILSLKRLQIEKIVYLNTWTKKDLLLTFWTALSLLSRLFTIMNNKQSAKYVTLKSQKYRQIQKVANIVSKPKKTYILNHFESVVNSCDARVCNYFSLCHYHPQFWRLSLT